MNTFVSPWALTAAQQVPSSGQFDNQPRPATFSAFGAHYEAHIKPHIEEFEASRLAALDERRFRRIVAVPASFTVVCVVWMLGVLMPSSAPDQTYAGLAFLAFGLFACVYVWVVRPIKTYNLAVKSKIFPLIFKFFGKDFTYSPQSPLTVGSLSKSGLIPIHDKAKTEDFVHGQHRGVGIQLMEAHLTKRQGNRKHRVTVTKFRGLFILLTMNKAFSGRTVVKRDSGAVLNWVGNALSGLQSVKLEDPEFERQFEVFSTNQIEARYLLTPSFMERLKSLQALCGAKSIQCSFYDDKLLLMVPSSLNRFETTSIDKPVTFEEDIKRILSEMSEIFHVVETLKLHERTGL